MASESAPLIESASAPSARSGPASQGRGLLYHWGPQAWIDMVMSKRMLVDRAGPLVPYTFLPILRMTTDPEVVDRGWADIKARREKIRLFDSPRERWRKRYGNFVREAEWALLELRKHFSQAQYEDIVVGTAAALGRENSAEFFEMMDGMAKEPAAKTKQKTRRAADGSTEPTWFQSLVFDMFNPAGFLTGPAKISEYDPAHGKVTMEIPDCAWHVCGRQEDLPNPDKLPEEGCLLICKGAFEALMNGEDTALRMEFEPHLPETSCTARMTWKPGA